MPGAVPADHPDRLPIVDRVPDIANAWFTSGHYRTGLLMAVATGEALARWIIEGRPRREVEVLAWLGSTDLHAPNRHTDDAHASGPCVPERHVGRSTERRWHVSTD